jgi:hypothetical protein
VLAQVGETRSRNVARLRARSKSTTYQGARLAAGDGTDFVVAFYEDTREECSSGMSLSYSSAVLLYLGSGLPSSNSAKNSRSRAKRTREFPRPGLVEGGPPHCRTRTRVSVPAIGRDRDGPYPIANSQNAAIQAVPAASINATAASVANTAPIRSRAARTTAM